MTRSGGSLRTHITIAVEATIDSGARAAAACGITAGGRIARTAHDEETDGGVPETDRRTTASASANSTSSRRIDGIEAARRDSASVTEDSSKAANDAVTKASEQEAAAENTAIGQESAPWCAHDSVTHAPRDQIALNRWTTRVNEAASRALWYVGAGRAEIRDERLAPLAPGAVRVRALHGAISRGTESLVAHGRVPAFGIPAHARAVHGRHFPLPGEVRLRDRRRRRARSAGSAGAHGLHPASASDRVRRARQRRCCRAHPRARHPRGLGRQHGNRAERRLGRRRRLPAAKVAVRGRRRGRCAHRHFCCGSWRRPT